MKRWQKITLGSVAGFLVFVVAITAIGSSKTKTVTKTLTVTNTVTTAAKTVTKTPASCLLAIGLLSQSLSVLNKASLSYSQQILPAAKAGLAGDAAAINGVTATMKRATAKVGAATVLARRALPLTVTCRNPHGDD